MKPLRQLTRALAVAAIAFGGYSDLAAGSHTFEITAVDASGESEPALYTWTIDLTPPAAPRLRQKPDDPSNKAASTFTWVGDDGVAFVCSVDGTTEACTSPHTTDPLGEGAHVFEVRAKDAAGNLSAPATWSWTVDLTPPANVSGTPDRGADANGWYNHSVTIAFTSTDPTATCSSVPYSGPDGESATVTGTCTDPAGNQATGTMTLKYDATPPTSVSGGPTRAPINGWYGSPVGIAFTGTDATSGMGACTNATYSGPDGIGISVTGTCADDAGNTSSAASSTTFNYDGSPPEVVVIAPAHESATSDATPRLRGTAGNGPADDDFVTVDLSGPTPITLIAPVADDASWSVSPTDALAPGGYEVTARQEDALDRGDASSTNTFTIDPSLQQVQISRPADGSVTAIASLTISGAAGTGAGFGPAISISIYAGTSFSVPLLTLAAPVSSGGWSLVAPALADGVYTLLAEQPDPAGGTSSDSVAVRI
ncbi:MAG: Ig-like domain-containing protein, partial [Gaiellaceae bacterium]